MIKYYCNEGVYFRMIMPNGGGLPKLVNISNYACTVFPHVPPSVGGRLEGAGGIGHRAQADPRPQQSALPRLEREDKHDEDGIGKKWLKRIQTKS